MLIQDKIENYVRSSLHADGWRSGFIKKIKNEFTGDFSINVFPVYRNYKTMGQLPGANDEMKQYSSMTIEEFTKQLSDNLKRNFTEIESINTINGFINILLKDSYWVNFIEAANKKKIDETASTNQVVPEEETIMIEFSSPNTNKPLHLGHIRNNLLGASLADILKASGKKVIRVNLVNDRGIHICKSMLAWKKWGNGETPESSGMKGDHLVGKYYVEFDKQVKSQRSQVKSEGRNEEDTEKALPLMIEVREMLRKWEANDPETMALWKKMNGWVYKGFEKTYKDLGIEFEKTYYESETYLLGKKIVEEGLAKGIFKKKDDGSVWIDLTKDGLDEKLLLRSDGTSVYITQDLGTAMQRLQEYKVNKLIYVVGNEQDYHFKVLFLIIKKLIEQNVAGFGSLSFGESGERGGGALFHLSYGMVDLPSGKMKSREGTVVDADDLIEQMIETAKRKTQELGKTEGLSSEEADNLYQMIGLAALKYFILKVDPKKRMLFNPEESIDFNGNTGPFIQYTYARIRSVLRKSQVTNLKPQVPSNSLHTKEKSVIKLIHDYPKVVSEAADTYNPGHIANYVYDLAKEYNQFYHECTILKAEKETEKIFRLNLSEKTAEVIKSSLNLLGISVPERM